MTTTLLERQLADVGANLTPARTYTEEVITPEMAADWLAKAAPNRPITRSHVRKLASAMERGAWSMTAEPIIFNTDGRLIDGQHRLSACIESGTSFLATIVRGVEPAAFDDMGGGKTRELHERLAMRGYTNAVAFGGVLRALSNYQQRGDFKEVWTADRADHRQLLAMAEALPSLVDSARIGRRLRFPRVPGAILGALHYLFTEKDGEDCDAFYARLGDGSGLAADDPIFCLRRRFLDFGQAKMTPTRNEVAAITIKAWNAYREGRPMKVLTYRSGGASPEPFPDIR